VVPSGSTLKMLLDIPQSASYAFVVIPVGSDTTSTEAFGQ
jgi:hypothetical protein